MSMDHVYPPRHHHHFSPPIVLKEFVKEADEAQDELFQLFHKTPRKGDGSDEDSRTACVNLLIETGLSQDDSVKVIQDVDAPFEEIVDMNAMDYVELGMAPYDSKLESHKVLRKVQRLHEHDKQFRKHDVVKRMRYFNFRDAYLEKPLEPSAPIAVKDFVVTVSLMGPMNPCSNRIQKASFRQQCEAKLLVCGRTPLVKFRDKIFCQADFWCNKEASHEIVESSEYYMTRFPASFMFIYDTFYVDKRETDTDISEPVREFMKRKKNAFKAHHVRDICDVRMEDLKLRLGQPYVYVHQGHCEHLMIFTDLRLMHVNDPQPEDEYPVMLYNRVGQKFCVTCKDAPAAFVVTESDRLPMNPAFMCSQCYRSFNFDRHMKIGNFKAYHFVDRGCLE